jgi:hypothetical protein
MYDTIKRQQCENPVHYDRMIFLLMLLNPACKDRNWACDAINKCISMALNNGDGSTGMCAAYRTTSGRKVRLFLEPIGFGLSRFDSMGPSSHGDKT